MDIANKREDGVQTAEILKDMRKRADGKKRSASAKKMLEGHLMLTFGTKTVK